MKNIAIFSSGNGTNAENIIKYFSGKISAKISVVFCNNPTAEVLVKAKQRGVETIVFNRNNFYETGDVLNLLVERKIDLIVLAGFLLLIPEKIISAFSKRIVNIHPALLPAHGGKGMYKNKVHEAVIEAKEKISGITIHYVNEKFDEGEIIFQAQCPVNEDETAESLSKKIHQLEYKHYPEIIEKVILSLTVNS